MKKLLSLIAIVGIMASCNNKKEEKTDTSKDTATTTTPGDNTNNTTPTDNTTPTGDVPTFSDPEVQKYVNDYSAFVAAYVEAYKSKDMTKVQELATKQTEWSAKTQNVAMKLANNPDEATKFSNYMTKLSQDWANAMMPANK
jgi:hypothetical protein